VSKAFVRESDDEPDPPPFPRAAPPLPPGAKNYLTAAGEHRLREELARLVGVERPRLLAATPDSETKRELQVLQRRILHLEQVLRTAVVVAPGGPDDRVRFGATVTVRSRDGGESDYRLVGTEETEVERGWVSWRSPLAQALLNARPGDRVVFASPSGPVELGIVRVSHE
jgi:transcription elongation factor GreB